MTEQIMKPSPRHLQFALSGLTCLLPLFVLLLAGCKSTSSSQPKPADGTSSSRLASTVIKGHSVLEVAKATQRVFLENGYVKAPSQSANLVFEKQGTTWNTLVYGDWSNKPVWVRVKAYIRELGSPEEVLLDCDAFMVVERGDAHFEEEHKLTKLRRGTYQELLDKVSLCLK